MSTHFHVGLRHTISNMRFKVELCSKINEVETLVLMMELLLCSCCACWISVVAYWDSKKNRAGVYEMCYT